MRWCVPLFWGAELMHELMHEPKELLDISIHLITKFTRKIFRFFFSFDIPHGRSAA